jgi:hypothetical protein
LIGVLTSIAEGWGGGHIKGYGVLVALAGAA